MKYESRKEFRDRLRMRNVIILLVLMCVVGTCMHFALEIIEEFVTNKEVVKLLGSVFPINETSWEHMKMFWYPFLGVGLLLSLFKRNIGYLSAFTVGGLTAMFVMLGQFAFYQSFTTTSVLILDIIFFLADMILCALLALSLAYRDWARHGWLFFLLVALVITATIMYLTYNPGTGYVFMDNTSLQ